MAKQQSNFIEKKRERVIARWQERDAAAGKRERECWYCWGAVVGIAATCKGGRGRRHDNTINTAYRWRRGSGGIIGHRIFCAIPKFRSSETPRDWNIIG